MPTNFIRIKFEEVKGYNKMGSGAQMVFKHVYRKHNSTIGEDFKRDWIPTNVVVCGKCLKVTFKNSEWLHYYQNGTWG